MSTVKVTEFASIGGGMPGSLGEVIDAVSTIAEQTITVGLTASTAFGSNTSYVEVSTDTACTVSFGSAPTTAGPGFMLPANTPRQFGVKRGQKVIAY